jgi:hypothetical protein
MDLMSIRTIQSRKEAACLVLPGGLGDGVRMRTLVVCGQDRACLAWSVRHGVVAHLAPDDRQVPEGHWEGSAAPTVR